jgi:membrane protein YqaA with SNARE-associated domain
VAGIAAGALRFPAGLFLVACIAGKTIRMVLLAYAGAGLLPRFSDWFM